jgi:hypothetical protein
MSMDHEKQVSLCPGAPDEKVWVNCEVLRIQFPHLRPANSFARGAAETIRKHGRRAELNEQARVYANVIGAPTV